MWKILMFEISDKKMVYATSCYAVKKTTWDLAAHFHAILALQIRIRLLFKRSTNIEGWQNSVNRIYEATCGETSQDYSSYVNEWGNKILDNCQLWIRIFPQRGNWGCFDWYCDTFLWPAPNLAISTQTSCQGGLVPLNHTFRECRKRC